MIFDPIPQDWRGRDVYVVGGGPSLRGRDLYRLVYVLEGTSPGAVVVGVNRAYETVPCRLTFTMDLKFLKYRRRDLERQDEVWAAVPRDHDVDPERPIPGVSYVERLETAAKVLTPDRPDAIYNGKHSGFGALCLSIKRRPARVFLLGFDLVRPRPDQPMHWHDGYEWDDKRSGVTYYDRWAKQFDRVADELAEWGTKVYNCNPESAVRAFPFTTYEEIGL